MADDEFIQRNRRDHLRLLVIASGGPKKAAQKIGYRASTYITQTLRDPPDRPIGDKSAARIEKAFALPPGAMDFPLPDEAEGPDPFISAIVATLTHASQADKEFVLHMSQWLAARSVQ